MTALPNTGVPVADVRQTITDIMRTELERDVDPSIDIFDQGATSLAFIRIVAQVNDKYGINVDVAELEEASIDTLSGLVAQQVQSQEPVTARD
ncbi:acyl carrier protein [Phytohabitans kaempferiae]|uniref:Acyl carrier protein n=1 Tax=Phytohabitans kaempferiae TaxID=1620943 RepID=A0ABV6LZB5_9ACTN